MVFKDAVILSFFLDKDDPDELAALAAFTKSLDGQLAAARLGRYDDQSYDATSHCFKVELLGNDADAMLAAIRPLVRAALFLIGPRATLIMRGYEAGAKVSIRHIDL